MYTEEVRVRLVHAPHTDSVKTLSRINPMCHATGGSPSSVSFFFQSEMLLDLFFRSSRSSGHRGNHSAQVVLCVMLNNRGKGSVEGGEAGKRAKTTPDEGGKSVSEKSQAVRTYRNPSRNQKVIRQNFSSVK